MQLITYHPDDIAGVKRRVKMTEQSEELRKLAAITTDTEFTADLRIRAIEQIGTIGSHEALLALLDVVANEKLTTKERELALERARKIIKSSPQ